MGQYKITHACGHDHVHQLYGKIADRERKEAWLAEQVCPECRRAEQAQANEAAQAANAEAGLPALEGTPKQIAWAETIRAGIVQQVEQVRSKLAEAGRTRRNAMYVKDFQPYESREDYQLDLARRISDRRAEQYQQVGLIEAREALSAAYSAVDRRMHQMRKAAKDAARQQAEAQGLGRRTTQAAAKAAVQEVETGKAYRKLMDVRRALDYARTHLSDAFEALLWEQRKAEQA